METGNRLPWYAPSNDTALRRRRTTGTRRALSFCTEVSPGEHPGSLFTGGPMSPDAPRVARLGGRFGCALTVDVEEWYHTCLVPGYVNPEGRPPLCQELDWLLPELLEMLSDAGRTATFFVLGEVAECLPRRVREIA